MHNFTASHQHYHIGSCRHFLPGYCNTLLDVLLLSLLPSLLSSLYKEARESFHSVSQVTSFLCSHSPNDYPSPRIRAKIFTWSLQPYFTCHSLVLAFSSPLPAGSLSPTNTLCKVLPQHFQQLFPSLALCTLLHCTAIKHITCVHICLLSVNCQ